MRGQLSLEYLLTGVAALLILIISLGILTTVNENGKKTLALYETRSFANELFATIDEICALGNGNARELVMPVPMALRGDGHVVSLLTFDASITHEAKCEIGIDDTFDKGRVLIENEKGTITVRTV